MSTIASFNLQSGNAARLASFLARHPALALPTRTTITWQPGPAAPGRVALPAPMHGDFPLLDVYELTAVRDGVSGRVIRSRPARIVWARTAKCEPEVQLECVIVLDSI